jgi:hypothetical protein
MLFRIPARQSSLYEISLMKRIPSPWLIIQTRTRSSETETEANERNVAQSVRLNALLKVGARNIISGLKVPRQCPLVLLVEVYLTQGEAFFLYYVGRAAL